MSLYFSLIRLTLLVIITFHASKSYLAPKSSITHRWKHDQHSLEDHLLMIAKTSKPNLGNHFSLYFERNSAKRSTSDKSLDSKALENTGQADPVNEVEVTERLGPGSERNLTLTFSQFKPFLRIAQPFFKEDKTARDSLAAVVALTLLNSGVSVVFSYISRDFYNALNARNEGLFYEKITLFFGALCIAVPISVYYRFLREKLSLYWREGLTERVLSSYYANRTYYVMETLREIDNPDQRITEDIRHFTKTSLDFLITLFTSVIDLFSFSAILFQIYPGLFVAIILYAGIGSIVTTTLGRDLVGLNYVKLQSEADFRFSLIRTRENAESIAFYDSDARLEQDNLWATFGKVLDNQFDIVLLQRKLEYFTTGYRYIVQILPSLIVAPLYFQNKIELGSISQSYGAFNHILGDFSLIINSFESLSAFSAGLTRLSMFLELVTVGGWEQAFTDQGASASRSSDESVGSSASLGVSYIQMAVRKSHEGNQKETALSVPETDTGPSSSTSTSHSISNEEAISRNSKSRAKHENVVLSCNNLTVLTPDGSRTLIGGPIPRSGYIDLTEGSSSQRQTVSGISLRVRKGDRVLIVGPSGCGKSSFVRAIAGLWRRGSGSIDWLLEDERLVTEGALNDVVKLRQRSGANRTEIGQAEEDKNAPVIDDGFIRSLNEDSREFLSPSEVFFLPQKPYNVMGTLREQVMYPSLPQLAQSSNGVRMVKGNSNTRRKTGDFMRRDSKNPGEGKDVSTLQSTSSIEALVPGLDEKEAADREKEEDEEESNDMRILSILREVKLGDLAGRMSALVGDHSSSAKRGKSIERSGLDREADWGKVLSLGEQQRLSFARVLYNRPQVVVLDESTSALDMDSEAAMYRLLDGMTGVDGAVTYLSVGHRPSLLKYHTRKLALRGAGRDVSLTDIDSQEFERSEPKRLDDEDDFGFKT